MTILKIKHLFRSFLTYLCLSAAFLSPLSFATVIQTQTVALGGQDWLMNIEVTNDDQVGGINEFTLYFNENFFSNLQVIQSPSDWDSLVVQPDTFLGAGFFDSYSAAGLGLGETVKGFVVQFSALAIDFPNVWSFDAYANDFIYLGSGESQIKTTSEVPESSSFLLLLIGGFAISLRILSQKKMN